MNILVGEGAGHNDVHDHYVPNDSTSSEASEPLGCRRAASKERGS